MSGYILCQNKRAELPYYIENISTNIYSIEELCFYMYHNIYLLDSTIINEELCFWIRDQLGLKRLSEKLYGLLDGEVRIGDFILLIFKEISYLSMEEFRRLNHSIQKFEQEPHVVREKLKGDYLMDHRKYVNAIKVYQQALHEKQQMKEKDLTGTQFVGEIFHNMGCAYARLFQMEEAVKCFSEAYEKLKSTVSLTSLLYGVYMEQGLEGFEKKALELDVTGQKKAKIRQEVEETLRTVLDTPEGREYQHALEEKEKGNEEGCHEILEGMIGKIKKEYRRSAK